MSDDNAFELQDRVKIESVLISVVLLLLLTIIIFLFVELGKSQSQPMVVPFDSPGGEFELDLNIQAELINATEKDQPYVNADNNGIILVKAKPGKQLLRVWVKPELKKERKSE